MAKKINEMPVETTSVEATEEKRPVEMALEKSKAEIVKLIDEYNDALSKKLPKADVDAIEQKLKETEAEYASEKFVYVASGLKITDDPVRSALTLREFEVVGHDVQREDKIVTGFVLNENKMRKLDLEKFCKFAKIGTDWTAKIQKFNHVLTVRVAQELNCPVARIKKLDDSFAISDIARKIELGETPTSNRSIEKVLQNVIDSIYFVDNGSGLNSLKCKSDDVNYALFSHSGYDRRVCTVKCASTKNMHDIVTDVLHHLITGKPYDIVTREEKSKSTTPVTEPAEVSKTETKSTKKSTKAGSEKTVTVKKSA